MTTTVLRTCRCGAIVRNPPCPNCRRSGSSRPELDRYAWQKIRRQVRQRDGNRCVSCGNTDRLSVHHLDERTFVTLCSICHREADEAKRRERRAVVSKDTVF